MFSKFIKNRFTDTPLKDRNPITTANNNYSKNKLNAGFTLVEVAVCVLLIAFFLVIFGPPIADMFKEIVNSSDNDASFNNAYNLTTYYGSTGIIEEVEAPVVFDDYAADRVTIFLFDADGVPDTSKNFTIPKVTSYYAPYDTGSFGNAKQLCFNDYYVDPTPAP